MFHLEYSPKDCKMANVCSVKTGITYEVREGWGVVVKTTPTTTGVEKETQMALDRLISDVKQEYDSRKTWADQGFLEGVSYLDRISMGLGDTVKKQAGSTSRTDFVKIINETITVLNEIDIDLGENIRFRVRMDAQWTIYQELKYRKLGIVYKNKVKYFKDEHTLTSMLSQIAFWNAQGKDDPRFRFDDGEDVYSPEEIEIVKQLRDIAGR